MSKLFTVPNFFLSTVNRVLNPDPQESATSGPDFELEVSDPDSKLDVIFFLTKIPKKVI
jgi:hypothetical protein